MSYRILVMMLVLAPLAYGNTARVSALALDEVSNAPIENVKIDCYFDQNDDPWFLVKSTKSPITVKVSTDEKGRCSAAASTPTGKVYLRPTSVPEGYYLLWDSIDCRFRKKNFFGTWQPDDTVVTMKFQRVGNPIPLYVNRTVQWIGDADSIDLFSGNGERAQLDLVKGDWLPPNGTGEVADVEFVRKPREDLGEIVARNSGVRGRMYRDTMEVRFLGENNGLVETETKNYHRVKIRMAPEDGYVQTKNVSRWRDENLQVKTSWEDRKRYCIRIRAKKDANGKLIDGLYGKIYGDIECLRVTNTDIGIGSVAIQYYLNLTPLDRNLEWNGKNLCLKPRRVMYGL